MDYQKLSSAPIKEAIFDIRVKARPDFDVLEFSKLKEEMREHFPKAEERRGGHLTIRIDPVNIGANQPDIQDLGLQGFFFKTEDEKMIAQFRVDGFTLNKLQPYSSWEELQPLVKALWDKYKAISKPVSITRCALRYINRIIINQTALDFNDYLTASPQVPNGLPQTISNFLSRITIVDEEQQLAAHVVQVFEPEPQNQFVPIVLDIDAFKNVDISIEDPILWDVFSSLRVYKNKLFFNFLTERTIEILK